MLTAFRGDEQAKILMRNFVFKFVPCLNPDGVYRGYYRHDTHNQNLNRFYRNPDPKLQPTIHAVKNLINHESYEGKLAFYFDLHAHAVKKGCFLLANDINDQSGKIDTMAFARLMSLNCLNFDYVECSFGSFDDADKDGSGRVAIGRETGLPHCYTVECNYQTGRRVNHLTPMVDKKTGLRVQDSPLSDIHSKYY